MKRVIVGGPEWDRARLGAETIRTDPAVMELARGGEHLRTLFGEWTDEASGMVIPVWARAMIVPRDNSQTTPALVSLVEVRNADPSVWESSAFASGAHIRAALLLALWNAWQEDPAREHLWVLVEREAPRLVARRRASQELLAEGRERLAELIAAYAACLKSEVWPRFEPEGATGLKAWQLATIQPWMTTGAGPHGGYYALELLTERPGEKTSDAFSE